MREREWHKSQVITDLPDGKVRVTLNVCNDYALRAWILGFGANVRVVSPSELVDDIVRQLDTSRLQYAAPKRMARAAMLKAG